MISGSARVAKWKAKESPAMQATRRAWSRHSPRRSMSGRRSASSGTSTNPAERSIRISPTP